MYILVTYDISTVTPEGCRRLTHVCQACKDFGQRVQYSVFEFDVDDAKLAILKQRLLELIEPKEDSIRIYQLRGSREEAVECHGLDKYVDFDGPLLF